MIKTPISYYGGKINMMKEIIPMLDYSKKQFVSPFVGGAAVEMGKAKHEVEVWNDLDCRVINFWMTLQDDALFDELSKKIKETLHHEKTYKETAMMLSGKMIGYTEVELAWAFWTQTGMSYSNALMNGFAFANDNSRNLQTANKREAFSRRFYQRVRLVQLFCRDGLQLIEMKDSEDTTFFIDPPYVGSQCAHYEDMFEEKHLKKLFEILKNLKGTFLMTSYPSEMLDEYRKECGWETQDRVYPLSVYGKREEKKFKTECITMNYRVQERLDLFND